MIESAVTATAIPGSIRTARTVWIVVAGCSAFLAATSAVMVGAAVATGTARTPDGNTVLLTALSAMLATVVAYTALSAGRQLTRGDAHARRVLAVVAVGLCIAAFMPISAFATGSAVAACAVVAGCCMYHPSASRFMRRQVVLRRRKSD